MTAPDPSPTRKPIMTDAVRAARYATISTSLGLLSDRRLGDLVDAAPVVGAGIGGITSRIEIDGVPVFVKRIRLTDLERRPENVMSTANMFGLPTYYQYGIGSTGFGAWRELAAHVMTTNWVLGRQQAGFPLMYHWRPLPGPASTHDEHWNLERAVAYWDNSSAVRERLTAIEQSSASLVVFLEHIPHNLHDWLTAQLAGGDGAIDAAAAMVERRLRADVALMNSRGLVHFDAHFDNVLTDGKRLYFADFGLALSPRFELSADESSFLRENGSIDACDTMTSLVNWLVTALCDTPDTATRNEVIREFAQGREPSGPAAAVIQRNAPIAAIMNDFYWKLRAEGKTLPYPSALLKTALDDSQGGGAVPAGGR